MKPFFQTRPLTTSRGCVTRCRTPGSARRQRDGGAQGERPRRSEVALMETSGASRARPANTRVPPECRCSASFETPLTATISRPLLPQATSTCRTSFGSLSKLKLDEFFLNWLSSPESQKLVRPYPLPTLPRPSVAASCRVGHAMRSQPAFDVSRARRSPSLAPSPCLPPCPSSDSSIPTPRHPGPEPPRRRQGRPTSEAPALPPPPRARPPLAVVHPSAVPQHVARRRHSPRRRAPPSPGLPVPARRRRRRRRPTPQPRLPPPTIPRFYRRRVGCARTSVRVETRRSGASLRRRRAGRRTFPKGDEGGVRAPLVLRSASDASHQRDESTAERGDDPRRRPGRPRRPPPSQHR